MRRFFVLVGLLPVLAFVVDADAEGNGTAPIVTQSVAFGESKPVSELPEAIGELSEMTGEVFGDEESLVHPLGDGSYTGPDPALQTGGGGSGIPPTSRNFEGIDIGESSSDGVFVGAPPDTNGDVGPNHYVQIVNTAFAIYSKTGTRLVGPTPINNIWKSAPNAAEFNCTAQSRGDPIVQYDPLADRWMISQFNFPGVAVILPPFDQCIAISKTPDPTGSYYLYDFHYSDTLFNDYPHFGVWPDAYYMSVNQFEVAAGGLIADFHSGGACAYEREKMLAGDPGARQLCFDESAFDPKDAHGDFLYGGQLPADLDGTGVGAGFKTPPPAGAPNDFMQFVDSTTAGQDKLLLFKFHVDWANPAGSWFGSGPGQTAPVEIPVADFNSNMCNFARNCIPQKDSADGLDSISDRLMYRLAYQNFGDHESLVLNHTVNAGDAANHAGMRWYELRDPNGTPSVHQQSTWAPDAEHRWMGSAAMDQAGDIALGYSLSSKSRNPAIAYTARRAGDTPGQMTLGEALMYQGNGAQNATGNRWGDYSSLSLDPDGCTFWYTTEHYLGTGTFNWGTRIGVFKLASCGNPQVTLNAAASKLRVNSDLTYSIGVASGQNPVAGATVSDSLPSGMTLLSVSTSAGSCAGTSTVTCDLGDLPAGTLETITLKVHVNAAGSFTNTATLSSAGSTLDTASAQIDVYDPCPVPGYTILTDKSGDALDQQAAHDIRSISVAEPGSMTNKLVFTLKMADLSTVPPDTTWPVTFFYGKNAAGADQQWFVAMKSDPLGRITFRYGTGSGSTNGIGDLDAGSGYSPDGTITLIVSNSKIAPASGGSPSAGQLLTGFLTRVRVESQTGSALTPDNAPDSAAPGPSYELVGNAWCGNVAPTAVLSASPTSGTRPLTVGFDASASSDPDDAIASYTFRFGDGSAPVTQSSPTVSHTYANAGTYHATLAVRDARGKESTNTAQVDITVQPAADLSVAVAGPATAKVGEVVTYTVTARNDGPDTADGVKVVDTLPKSTGFGSASSTQGSCAAPPAKSQNVVCTIGTMASGATVTIKLVVKLKARGNVTNAASISASSPNDPVSGNNTSSVTTVVGRG